MGGSTTTTTVNPSTDLPDADPFLWHNGNMIDLGTLGCTNGFAQCANHRHQVIGMSSLAANPAACDFPVFNSPGPGCHAFFWEDSVIKDLGTLGGDNSEAIWLNEDEDVGGSADLAGLQAIKPTMPSFGAMEKSTISALCPVIPAAAAVA